MRIAYCEDEPAQRSRMELLLRTFAERKRLPLTVEAFSDSAAFLFQYPGSYPFDLIFLDIDLGGMDGMALARKIRETDSEVPILFLTNHKEYVFEGYEVQAFRYLLKPVTEDTLFPLLEELQAMRGQEKPHLLLSLGGETQKLFLSDLLFVESDNHYLTLHTAAGMETFKKNLSEFREELSAAWQASGETGECFAAAHRSYLVNLAHVERITRTECLLSDGTKIPVSRGCYASLNMRSCSFTGRMRFKGFAFFNFQFRTNRGDVSWRTFLFYPIIWNAKISNTRTSFSPARSRKCRISI